MDLWMFIPLKMALIGIDPYPYGFTGVIDLGKSEETMGNSRGLKPHEIYIYIGNAMIIFVPSKNPRIQGSQSDQFGFAMPIR